MRTLRTELTDKTVLAVDDSKQITSLLRDVFVGCGARVTTVNTGKTALLQLQLRNFDLVILDLIMPKPDGWDLMGFLRRQRPDMLPGVMLLTGDRYDRETAESLRDLDVPVVFKPFSVEALRQAARDVLSNRVSAAMVAPPAA